MTIRRLLAWAGVLAMTVATGFGPSTPPAPRAADEAPGVREKLPIGSQAPMPEAAMPGTDGDAHSIRSAARANGVVVLFVGTTCSWVKAWEDRFADVAQLAQAQKVGVIAVNSNTTGRSEGESRAAMKKRAVKKNYPFPYVLDRNARLADAFGATTMPEVFLFNGNLRLVYRGAIDDDARAAASVDHHYLRSAITAMTEGSELPRTITSPVGCTIQRSE